MARLENDSWKPQNIHIDAFSYGKFLIFYDGIMLNEDVCTTKKYTSNIVRTLVLTLAGLLQNESVYMELNAQNTHGIVINNVIKLRFV